MGKFSLIWFREIMKRAISLDAFRGFAIIMMVLSGTIASNVLPAWMYHAQVLPRSNYNFDPTIYGISIRGLLHSLRIPLHGFCQSVPFC
jgi:hypothetical protein